MRNSELFFRDEMRCQVQRNGSAQQIAIFEFEINYSTVVLNSLTTLCCQQQTKASARKSALAFLATHRLSAMRAQKVKARRHRLPWRTALALVAAVTAAALAALAAARRLSAPPSSDATCWLVGQPPGRAAKDAVLHANSRVACGGAPVCVPAAHPTTALYFSGALPRCAAARAQAADGGWGGSSGERGPLPDAACAQVRHWALACAHGEGWADGVGHPRNNCTALRALSPADLAHADAAGRVFWHEGVTVLVPSYAWVFNIAHYARQLHAAAAAVRSMRRFLGEADWQRARENARGARVTVRVMFRLQGYYPGAWHTGMRDIFFSRIFAERAGLDASVLPEPTYLFAKPGKDFVCLRHAIVLGAEGSTDAMQFGNDSVVRASPPDLPREALDFREDVYAALNISAAFARRDSSGDSRGAGHFTAIAVPPATVGYALREANSSRSFAAADEIWFRGLLEDEARSRNLTLHMISVPPGRPLAAQVADVSDIGFLVGLHGANLVNAMFMRPAGALFEVFPYKYVKSFYRNGGNAGLRYSSHEVATGEERACNPYTNVHCQTLYRDVVVTLTAEDRATIAKHVRDGMDYVVRLRAEHPAGWVPIRRARDVFGGPYRMAAFDFAPSPLAIDQYPYTFRDRNSTRSNSNVNSTAAALAAADPYRPKVSLVGY